MSASQSPASRGGLVFGFAAYGLWGMMPLYFRAVRGVSAIELLAHRIVWSCLLLCGVITMMRRWSVVVISIRHARTRWLLLLSTLLIAVNWYVFIYGVEIGQVIQNSLGYFINPLLNIVLGVVVFSERLRRAQWIALLLAIIGVAYLIVSLGTIPWIAFTLACTFAIYGLIRKVGHVDALVGLTAETIFLAPIAGTFLLLWFTSGTTAFGTRGATIDFFLLASAVVTTVPLLCFGEAARRLRMTTLGFLQYIAPTLQFCLAVLYYQEPFLPEQQVSFTFIWLALAIVTFDQVIRHRQSRVRSHGEAIVDGSVSTNGGLDVVSCVSKQGK